MAIPKLITLNQLSRCYNALAELINTKIGKNTDASVTSLKIGSVTLSDSGSGELIIKNSSGNAIRPRISVMDNST